MRAIGITIRINVLLTERWELCLRRGNCERIHAIDRDLSALR